MLYFIVLALICAVAGGAPSNSQRIVGGQVTAIANYPGLASLMFSQNLVTYRYNCVGNILNNRSILTAGHCTQGQAVNHLIRVGSSSSTSGGTVYSVATIITHPQYNIGQFMNNDIGILRTSSNILFSYNVQSAVFSGANYDVPNYAVVWAAGWGWTEFGANTEQLRHVRLWAVNPATCNTYHVLESANQNMICSVNQGTGGAQCQGDSGGPLYHNGIVVGIASYGPPTCGNPNWAVVNTRVSSYIDWIQANA